MQSTRSASMNFCRMSPSPDRGATQESEVGEAMQLGVGGEGQHKKLYIKTVYYKASQMRRARCPQATPPTCATAPNKHRCIVWWPRTRKPSLDRPLTGTGRRKSRALPSPRVERCRDGNVVGWKSVRQTAQTPCVRATIRKDSWASLRPSLFNRRTVEAVRPISASTRLSQGISDCSAIGNPVP